ncbi:unnamed protein product [Fusarium graminearum]|uniref:Chromosome 3, complete genome n=1 Tax=Gibberella zeae (strain ATCC MYA-4620 / CBS 123657 / FGSC 9075 / NRRL 31084 / PH-1) TaxID=229533 RepID=A0A098E403_GIBZE|nr:unnamed protein product [Fusarium graminearum]
MSNIMDALFNGPTQASTPLKLLMLKSETGRRKKSTRQRTVPVTQINVVGRHEVLS